MSTSASSHARQRPPNFGRWLLTHPFTLAASIYLIVNGVRFMLIKDFSEWDHVFVLAASRLRGGEDIYQLSPLGQDHAYSYPPLWAMLAVPFSLLPRFVARFIWFLVNVLCVTLLWRWSWKISGGPKLEGEPAPAVDSRWSLFAPDQLRQFAICILGLLCGMRFVQDNFDHQQTDLVIGAIVIGGCLAWQDRRDWLAATCWGLAGAMKGPPMLFAAYLVWRGRWAAALWMVALAIGVNLLPDLVHPAPQGIWLQQWYVEMIRPMSQIGAWHSDTLLNQSLAGAARRWFSEMMSPAALKRGVYLVEAVLLALTALCMGGPLKRAIDSRRAAIECSLVLLLMLLFSPMSSKPHFCVILLPAFVLARLAIEDHRRAALLAVLICIFLADVLDRNVLRSRAIGDAALHFGSVMWAAGSLWAGCLMVLTRDYSYTGASLSEPRPLTDGRAETAAQP